MRLTNYLLTPNFPLLFFAVNSQNLMKGYICQQSHSFHSINGSYIIVTAIFKDIKETFMCACCVLIFQLMYNIILNKTIWDHSSGLEGMAMYTEDSLSVHCPRIQALEDEKQASLNCRFVCIFLDALASLGLMIETHWLTDSLTDSEIGNWQSLRFLRSPRSHHSKGNVTQYGTSLKMECHSKWNVS